MNEMAKIGDNNPPDPIDEALAPFLDSIEEAEHWLDGQRVEDEAAMKAVDALISDIRKAKSDLGKAKKSATAPLHDAWKGEIARWKPTEDDIERRLKGLAAIVDPFKRKIAAEKEEQRVAAIAEAKRKDEEARAAAEKADAGDYSSQVEAEQAAEEAKAASKAASAASKDTVKGLRSVTKHEIDDHRAALHWIASNDRDAITDFITEYVRRNHKTSNIDGVRVWQEKEAY